MLGALGPFQLASLKINRKRLWLLPLRLEELRFVNFGRDILLLMLSFWVLVAWLLVVA